MTIIYGVDTAKPVFPHDVRDALVACFVSAHSDALDDLRNYASDLKNNEFDRMKVLNVQQMIRGFFKEVGGDFEAPTKESITKVIEKLKEFAQNFRNPEIISKHYCEIIELAQALS